MTWHVWPWLSLGPVLWAARVLSTLLVQWPWARKSALIIEADRGVTLVRSNDVETYAIADIRGVYLETEPGDEDSIGGNMAGIVTAAGRVCMAKCISFAEAPQVAKAGVRP